MYGVLTLLALLANMMVAFEGHDEIFQSRDSSGQFMIKNYCKEIYKGFT